MCPAVCRRSLPWAAGIYLVALAALTLHAGWYLPFIADDALISLRYAERLLAGQGLTWTDGEVVEGYSNLLWILLCALLGRSGLDLILAARLLGLVGMGAALLAVVRAHWPSPVRGPLPALLGTLGLAATGPVAVWTFGGMEQPLLAALLAWSLVLCLPLVGQPAARARLGDLIWPSLLLGLCCLTRPDGPVLAAGLCLGLLLAAGGGRRALGMAALLASVPLLAVVGQLVFRLAYYGDWLPNPAWAKVAFTPERLAGGVRYVAGALLPLAGLLLPAATGLVAATRERMVRPRVVLFVCPLALWIVYVALIGGDTFPAWRQLVPAVVILGLVSAEGIAWVAGAGEPRRRRWAWAAAGILLVLLAGLQLGARQNRDARRERWEWHGRVIGTLLRRAFARPRPLLAVDAAGSLPYFSRLPALDMLGLSDRYLAHHRPAGFGRGPPGHELGDGGYVLRRRPDLLIFGLPCGGVKGAWRSSSQLAGSAEFRRLYRPVLFEGHEPRLARSVIWVRREGGRVGIRRDPERVLVPGYLIAGNPASVARLDTAGRIGMAVSSVTPARIDDLELGPGCWRCRVESSGAAMQVRIWRREKVLGRGSQTATIQVPGPSGGVSLLVHLARGTAHVRAVRCRRCRPAPR